MARHTSFLRRLWNRRANAATDGVPEGMVRTAHGRLIIPFRVSTYGGGISNNVVAFINQPRARELRAWMEPYVTSPHEDDRLLLDTDTGRFYLHSDRARDGDKAAFLGEIDMQTEEGLFKTVTQHAAIARMFRQAGPGNPVHVDDCGRPVHPRRRR